MPLNATNPRTCERCGEQFIPCSSNNANRFCSRRCYWESKTIPLADRFWAKVDKSGDCWVWTAYRNKGGYGTIGEGRIGGRNLTAHRASWELHYGPIPDGMEVCHKCDNPPCVRPDHLFLGTRLDNAADRVTKQRGVRGERQRSARLTEDDVRTIRELAAQGVMQRQLKYRFKMSDATISAIVRRKTWKHVA